MYGTFRRAAPTTSRRAAHRRSPYPSPRRLDRRYPSIWYGPRGGGGATVPFCHGRRYRAFTFFGAASGRPRFSYPWGRRIPGPPNRARGISAPRHSCSLKRARPPGWAAYPNFRQRRGLPRSPTRRRRGPAGAKNGAWEPGPHTDREYIVWASFFSDIADTNRRPDAGEPRAQWPLRSLPCGGNSLGVLCFWISPR